MKDLNKVHVKTPTKQLDDKSFQNEVLWESEHVLDAMQRTCSILDVNYQKANLNNIGLKIKHLSQNEQSMIHDVLYIYKQIFEGTLGPWETKPVDIELYPGSKPYNS